MSSESCPFCGKTYKRLKSHLPHCKAAAARTRTTSQTPQIEHDVKTNRTTSLADSSTQLVGGVSEPIATGKKSRQSKKSSAESASASSAPPQSSSAEPPPTTKKKKQKLSEPTKVGVAPPSVSDPPLPPSPAASKSKKKSLRDLIEATKPDQATHGSLGGTRPGSEAPPTGPTPPRSRTAAPTKSNIISDSAGFGDLSSNTKPKDAPKKKASSKTKRAPPSPPAARDTDPDLDSGSDKRARARDDFWLDNTGEVEDSSVSDTLLKTGGGHPGGVTIRDARAALGRAKTTSRSVGARILSQAETTDGRQTLTEKSSASERASLIPPQRDGSSQPKLPLLSGPVSSQVSAAPPPPPPPPHVVAVNKALNVGRHMTELLSPPPPLPPVQFSRPHLFPLVPRVDHGSKLWDAKQNSAHSRQDDAATRRSLGQVTLRELPEWLVCRAPRRPRDVVETVQRGWQWYYRRYIDVKRGGVGGVGMLLAGYCVISYVWSYPHIKCDRWRKYH